MGSKSKNYGKGFEYEIRDVLREATGIQSFERVPTSGAWIGGKNAYKAQTGRDDVTEIMAGDIICPQGWRWTVECKNHENVPFHQLFLGEGSKTVDSFLAQIYDAAKTARKEPLLVMKLRKKAKKNSIAMGTLVAELAEHSFDISGINHIQYTGKLSDDISATWLFFDLDLWLEHINERQFKKSPNI